MLAAHAESGSVFQAANFVKDYLDEDSDICITDDSNRILQQFGSTMPDFECPEDQSITGDYICTCYGSKDGEKLLKSMDAFLKANIRIQETFAHFAMATLSCCCGAALQNSVKNV